MADWTIERLADDHQRSQFSCGKAPLDRFIREFAGQYERRDIGRTYVAVAPGERRVIGYYTLAAGGAEIDDLPKKFAKKLPKHPVPLVRLGRLAVDQQWHGRRMGADLIADAFRTTVRAAEIIGVYALFVDAIDDSAREFYEKFGFTPFVKREMSLFLPMTDVRDAVSRIG